MMTIRVSYEYDDDTDDDNDFKNDSYTATAAAAPCAGGAPDASAWFLVLGSWLLMFCCLALVLDCIICSWSLVLVLCSGIHGSRSLKALEVRISEPQW